MSEELENSVREMLREETWTRAGINNFTKNNLVELAGTLEKARAENSEEAIKAICDEQLSHNAKDSIIALYLSGMIGLRSGSLDNSALVNLVDIFEKNHKESLVEHLCKTILEEDPQNKFALRKLAGFYKDTNDDQVWELYEQIVKLDFEEADIAKILADRYDKQGNEESAISYYKKALLRYITLRNTNAVKEVWSKLVSLIPEEIDFFLLAQRKVSKSISEDKSALLMQELYQYYKNTAKWDTAIDILKLILAIDNKDSWARREIIECFRGKYADHSHLEDYIKSSNLAQSFRNVFEAIGDFEKHIAFDANSYVFHRSWGVGIIRKVQGDMLTINFGKKNGVHEMSLKMAVSALQPLAKDHIWVLKAIKNRDELTKKIESDVTWTLKTIIKSFDNNCDDKRIKAELVPSILSPGKWTGWHAKAQKVLETDSTFGVNPNDINFYTVRDHEISAEERLANEFKAEKSFFSRIDIFMRYSLDDSTDKTDELFSDMYSYFAGYLKSFTNVNEQVVASYLVVQNIIRRIPSFTNPAKFTFAQLYDEIANPRETYLALKDTKNTSLRQDFIAAVRQLPNWDSQFVRLFPTVLSPTLITALIESGKTDKVQRLVQDSFDDYRTYRNAVIYFYRESRKEEWFKASGIPFEKQLVTLVNIISVCYREINNHVNTTENKKTIKAATTLLFNDKDENDEKVNTMLSYMLSHDTDTITRMYTMVNDVKDLDAIYKAQLRTGILNKHPDFKFEESEVKQEAPKGLLVTQKQLDAKKAEADNIEKVEIPKNAEEVNEARAKGDLSENAEYETARNKQKQLNAELSRLKEEIARAVVFDPTTITTSMVSFGTTVQLHNNADGTDFTRTILGPWESAASETDEVISYLSPFANAILDAKAGDTIQFTVRGTSWDVTIREIKAAKL
ncbi:MAG: transcription elongation factor GreA [Treponema sp.]|nr:transcription elongation factor GreA [Treponema sp.]